MNDYKANPCKECEGSGYELGIVEHTGIRWPICKHCNGTGEATALSPDTKIQHNHGDTMWHYYCHACNPTGNASRPGHSQHYPADKQGVEFGTAVVEAATQALSSPTSPDRHEEPMPDLPNRLEGDVE